MVNAADEPAARGAADLAGTDADALYDLVIVGGGPCGLACAAAAQQAGLRYRVLEKGAIVNSLVHFPIQINFFSTADNLAIAGIPFVTERPNPTRREALDYYRAVVQHLGLAVDTYTEVVDVRREGDGTFRVLARRARQLTGAWPRLEPEGAAAGDPAQGTWQAAGSAAGTTGEAGRLVTYRARNVVLATGYYDRPNRLGVPGEDLPHVSHYYREGHAFYGQRVLVVGGQNSAVEAALDLHRCGAQITLAHRGPALSQRIKPWVLPPFRSLVEKGRITVLYNTEVEAIEPEAVRLRVAGEPRRLPADFVFLLVGYRPNHHLVHRLGIPVDPATGEPRHDPDTMATPVPGVYLAGVVAAGYDANKIFIENGRWHGERIVRHILARNGGPRP
ncbi:FAD-dependent pyridine nucleotide-disulfide oxidoreductase [Thermaerobacter marianensis DSM 12885]|uniref:FAD-dependent pyridine nucleotide-disulfide oxidoreductase n=1 Tax=Thermaerobacter marianensis (strain ATCC 700841 / DSM 12885 / JCM 10246 / 7p75a) TaxID=644966 RepID=E6SIJ8_THEM7|nr:NAD(P)-binding domain-containing protein [Thermaerobacter marianensis]ADU50904.1 FAD-dependent pyridine nucleotide-disulfide oxidoreductase [Thermaerobacter marianensis DSM 12885]